MHAIRAIGRGVTLLLAVACRRENPAHAPPPAPVDPAPPSLSFEPARRDHGDLAVGETLVERVTLRATAPFDWRGVDALSSCECLSARLVEPTTPTAATVELEYHGDRVEKVDGHVTIEDRARAKTDRARARLADFGSSIDIARRPFVMPREVELEKEARLFDLVVGQAFALDAKQSGAMPDSTPDSMIDELPPYDENVLSLADLHDEVERTLDHRIARCRLRFELQEEARARAFETKITIRFGAPAVTRTVLVRHAAP